MLVGLIVIMLIAYDKKQYYYQINNSENQICIYENLHQ